MFSHQGIWLPDGERHFPEWMSRNGELVDGRGTYQIKKLRAALQYVRRFRTAIDVGAHVGLWSMQLLKRFQTVAMFEPVATFRACLERNIAEVVSAATPLLYPCALGAAPSKVRMIVDPADTGGTHVDAVLPGDVEMRALDEYDFRDVDFIKLDCEGYEHHVLAGAKETLTRWRPVIIVEQKAHKLGPNYGLIGKPAVDLLVNYGYRKVAVLAGDFIMVPQ